MGRRTWGPAVVALLGLLVAGCSDPEPRFADPTESASPSVSASASEPAQPQALSREETVRAWVEARNAALEDGDVTAMAAMATADCQGCEPFEELSKVYEAGGYIRTRGWTIAQTGSPQPNLIDLRVRTAAGVTVAEEGAKPDPFAAGTRDLRFQLVKEGSQWKIEGIAVFTG